MSKSIIRHRYVNRAKQPYQNR